MKTWRWVFLSCTLALFWLLSSAGEVAAQDPTETPTPAPLYLTATPVTIYDGLLPCPSGNPVGWGVVTPSPRWLQLCGHCVDFTDVYETIEPISTPGVYPTVTPLGWVTPQATTVYTDPWSGPTATPAATLIPTVSPTPVAYPSLERAWFVCDRNNITCPDVCAYWRAGTSMPSYVTELPSACESWITYGIAGAPGQVKTLGHQFYFCIAGGDSGGEADLGTFSVTSSQVTGDWVRSHNNLRMWTREQGDVSDGSLTLLYTGNNTTVGPYSVSRTGAVSQTMTNVQVGSVGWENSGQYETAAGHSNSVIVFETELCWSAFGVTIPEPTATLEPTQTPAPTVTAVPDDDYCFVVEAIDEDWLGIELPSFGIGHTTCAGIDAQSFSIPVVGDVNFPGISVCFKRIEFGVVDVIGVQIDIDILAALAAGVSVLRVLLRS